MTERPIYIKSLGLVTPEVAFKDYDLVVDKPVLTSAGGLVDTPLIWQRVGQILESPTLDSSRGVGIGYEAHSAAFLTRGNDSSYRVQLQSWVAIIDPIGANEERASYFQYAKTVRVEEIRAYCYRCLETELRVGIVDERTINEPLQDGLIIDRYRGLNGQGNLFAVCGVEKHPELSHLTMYRFGMSGYGELTLNNP